MEKNSFVRNYSIPKKALSVFLSCLMVLTAVAVGIMPFGSLKANAAVPENSYKWRIKVNSEHGCDGWSDEKLTVYGKSGNATGGESQIFYKEDWNIDFDGWRDNTFGEGDQTTSQFPTKITYHYDFGGGFTWRELRFFLYLEVYDYRTEGWKPIPLRLSSSDVSNSLSIGDEGGGNDQRIQAKSSAFSAARGTITYDVISRSSSLLPYIWTGGSISAGDTDVYPAANGSSNDSYKLTASDQFGVKWTGTTTWTSSHEKATITTGNYAGATVQFGNNGGTDYKTTLTATLTTANTSHTTTQYTKEVNVWALHTLTINPNGGTWAGSTNSQTFMSLRDDLKS